MKKGGVLVFILLFFVASLALPITLPVAQAEAETPLVIINELAWAGSSSSSQDEWIELKNTTEEDIDLTNWQITKDTSEDSSNETLMIEIEENLDNPEANTIPAGGYFLIANNGPEHDFGGEMLSVLNVEPNYIDSSITLSNSNLLIKLYNGSWDEEGELIDSAGDGSLPLAGSNSAKTSMERNVEYNFGRLVDSWHEASSATNLDVGVFDQATPKSGNSLAILPPPTLISVSPNVVDNLSKLEIEEIVGNNFSTAGNIQVCIRLNGTVLSATDVNVVDQTNIDSAIINTIGATAGEWDLVVINSDGQEGILADSITITETEEEDEDYSNDIIVTELYPKPDTGSNDEFIELYNQGNNSVNLKGWKLDDQSPGGSAEYIIDDDTIIEAHQYLAFLKSQTHISLNDTGDYARLIQPDGTVLDKTSNYDIANKGESFSLIDGMWRWSTRVTRNAQNILEIPEDETDEGADQEESKEEKIELALDFDTVTTQSVELFWESNIKNQNYVDLLIYFSDEEEVLGDLIDSSTLLKESHTIKELTPGTKYFFTVLINYQDCMYKSNQVEVITLEEIINNTGYEKQIVITEILPNPEIEDEEFIELYNPTDEMVNIAGWRLVDASSRSYVINALDLPPITITALQSNSVILPPKQYILLEQSITNLHLNNSGGEEIFLFDTEDNIIDSVAYSSNTKRGYAYVLAPNSKWFWSNELTPGEANDISFAGVIGDGGEYLTASGAKDKLWTAGLISLILSVIMFIFIKRYEYYCYQK